MAHTENSLAELNQDERVRTAISYKERQERTLAIITNGLVKLRKNYSKLGSDFSIAR